MAGHFFVPLRMATVVIALSLAGCSTIKGAPPSIFNRDLILKNTELTPAKQVALINSANTDQRNLLVFEAIAAIDIRYKFFVEDLISDRANVQSGFALAVLAMSTAGASVASAAAKTNYALYSAAATGAQGVMDKNYFYEKTVAALISAMDAARAQKFLAIKQNLGLELEKYGGSSALRDILEYSRAGSLEAALTQITKSSEVAANKASDSAATTYVPSSEEIDKIRQIRTNVQKEPTSANLDKFAQSLGIAKGATIEDTRKSITDHLSVDAQKYIVDKQLLSGLVAKYNASGMPALK